MKIIHRLFFLAFVALGLFGHPAFAASPKGKYFYGSLFVGAVVATERTRWARGDAPRVNLPTGSVQPGVRSRNVEIDPDGDIGFDVGAAFGGWVNNYQRIELFFGYRGNEGNINPIRGVGLIDSTDDNMDNPTVQSCGGARTTSAPGVMPPVITDDPACPSFLVDAYIASFLLNTYFHPLRAFDLIPEAHQPYIGFGLGVALWSFEIQGFDDDYKPAMIIAATIGYDLYLSDVPEIDLPPILDPLTIGLAYKFSWSNPKPEADPANAAVPQFVNASFNQNNHAFHFITRYEF